MASDSLDAAASTTTTPHRPHNDQAGRSNGITRLGASGLKVSRISPGCMSYGDGSRGKWALDYDAAAPFVRQALELGITFWDTALAARPGQRGTSRNS